MTPSKKDAKDCDGRAPHIKPDLTITPEEYMKDRVVYKICVYDQLSKQHERLYLATSFAGIVLAASVPVFINLGCGPFVPTIISLAVTILVSLEKLFHFREHWRNYDEMAALLRSEQVQFQTGAGEYEGTDKAFDRFVMRVEQAIGNERKDTIGMRTQETNAGVQGN